MRSEPECPAIDAYRSTRIPSLFSIHSRRVDEAAFGVNAELANTIRFIEEAEKMIDHPFDVTRSRMITRM